MKKKALLCCFCLWVILDNVDANRQKVPENNKIVNLTSIVDLKEKTKFGQDYPRHGLQLLFWFANNVEIDQNDVVRCHFIPNQGDYGFHRYRNEISDHTTQRAALPDISNTNSRYYSLGNLNEPTSFPEYVTQDYYNGRGLLRNMDRVVIRISDNQNRLDDVYITQHYTDRNRGSGYDPDNTFRVLSSLLREIQGINRDACVDDTSQTGDGVCRLLDDEQRMTDLQRAYPETPGLVRFMVRAGYNPDRVIRYSETLFCWTGFTEKRGRRSLDTHPKCQEHNNIKLKVKSTSNGYTRITWSGIPENLLKMEVNIGLYEEKTGKELKIFPLDGKPYGTRDTKRALNPGLQVKLMRLDKEISEGFFYSTTTTYYTYVWIGQSFNDANGVLPTDIRGYAASLQLYTRDGYACARLYIKKSFTDWKNVFENSWVGFYSSTLDDNDNYEKYQWTINFKKTSNQDYTEDYDIYTYASSLAVGPGRQARFMLTKNPRSEKARTEPWDGVVNPQSPPNDELKKK